MTKEQEETLEKVNRIRIDFFDSKYKDVHTDDELEEKYEALGDVLNMLKENSAEIEQKNTELAEKSAEIEKYKYLYQKALDNTIEADRENIQLKKQIDLMATTLSAICTGLSTVRDHFEKEYCEFINSDKDCCWKTDTSCKDCIKQYFERKVRDERN